MTPSTVQRAAPQLQLIPSSGRSITQQHGVLINPAALKWMGCVQPFEVWLQVAGRIFKAIPAEHYPHRLIGLPHEECLMVPAALANHGVTISLFKQGRANLHPITTLFIEVFYKSSKTTQSYPAVMMKDEILNVIRPALENQFFFEGQLVLFPVVGATLNLTIRLPIEGDEDQPFSMQRRAYAFVDRTTEIALRPSIPGNLKILNGFKRAADARLSFQIYAPKPTGADEFILLHNDELKTIFFRIFKGKSLHINQKLSLDVPDLGPFSLMLYSLQSPSCPNLSDYCVRIEEGQVIAFFTEESSLKILHGTPRIAKGISVVISEIYHLEEAATYKLPLWFAAADLTRSIKRTKPGIVPNQKLSLLSSDFVVKTAVTNIDYDGVRPKVDQHWKLGHHSHVSYKMNCGDVPLVDTNVSTLLRSITFEISIPQWAAPLELSYERVLRAVLRHAKHVVATNQQIAFTLRGVPHPMWAKATSLTPVEPCSHIYGFLGEIRSTTEKKLESASRQLNLVRITPTEALSDPVLYLRRLGLGGLSEDCISTLQELLLMNASVRSELVSRSVIPPSGILIHGPSGTGKTSLAKAIGQLLGIPKSRFHLSTGAALVGSSAAETTQNIRKLFSQIPRDSITHLHLVVIDNLEALDGSQHMLKAELRALGEHSHIFVIGICEDTAVIAPELLHPRYLYPQIALRLPNKKERAEVFDIHLSKHSGNGNVADDVCVKSLAAASSEFSQNEIALVVNTAFNHALPAALTTHVGGSSAEAVDAVRITMDGLLSAIELHREAAARSRGTLAMYS